MDPNKSQVRRQRAPKTTAEQYEVFLGFATRNPVIIDSKRDPLDSDALVQQKWDELTVILNTSGRGPQRTTKEWQNTFSNWKNSIRHKMKCIMDGSSRTLLSEMEGRALQLWDIVAYNRLPKYVRKRPAVEADDMHGHDESTHSSSAYYSGGGGGGGGGGNASVGGTHIKEELVIGHNGHDQQGGDHDMYNGSEHDPSGLLDVAAAAAAAAAAQSTGGDEEDEEYEDENSTPMPMKITQALSMSSTPMMGSTKRRKYDSYATATPPPYSQPQQRHTRRNGTSTARGADELDGSILIAESIAKLADNVGQMAESIRDIAAAFTTTTQAAFELIRRQSEIIQGLIEK